MKTLVELTGDGKRIELTVEYQPGINILCKQVLGYKFVKEARTWTYPLRMETCHSLRAVFGAQMEIGPRLTRWAREAGAKSSKQRALASKPDSDLSRVKSSHPLFWEAMSSRPYQRSGAEFLSSTGIAACFDEPGLGKTAELLAAIIQHGSWEGRHLVIVSNKTAIRSTWEREIMKWTPDAKVYAMPDGRAKREKVLKEFMADEEGARFLLIIPHMLQVKVDRWCNKCKMWMDNPRLPDEHIIDSHKPHQKDRKIEWPELFEIDWTAVIADECHDYLLKLRPPMTSGQPQWAHGMRRIGKKSKLRFPATGTPFRGREINIYGILYWMDPVKYSSYWHFVDSFFEVVESPYDIRGGGGARAVQKTVGRLLPEKEKHFYELIDSLCLRRTRAEVRNDLPKEDMQEHWVPLTGEHRRQYDEFEELGYVMLESGVLEGMGRLAELTRLRQLAFGPWDISYGDYNLSADIEIEEVVELPISKMTPLVGKSPKVQLLIDMLGERGALRPVADQPVDARKFIIASQYVTILDGIRDLLTSMKVPSLILTGRQTSVMRGLAVKSFTEPGGPKILLLNTKAGGASLTLDTMCDEMFVLDETWVHDDQVQLMGRINNRGSDIRPRSFHFFRTEDTIDERVALGNDEQNSIQSQILDRRRGQDVALSLLRKRA